MAFLHQMPHERIGGLQIQNIKLVDARRNHEERLFVHLLGERFVLDELKKFVFKDHRALRSAHIAAHFKLALIRHRHMALANISEHVLHALRDALALRVGGFLQCFGVQRKEVRRRGRCNLLLSGKAQSGFGFFIGLHTIDHLHHRTRIQQIQCRGETGDRICAPSLAGKAAVSAHRGICRLGRGLATLT